jgi:hypothetical protein
LERRPIGAVRALLGCLAVLILGAPVSAQEAPGTESSQTNGPTLQGLAKDKQNPFTESINVPVELATGFSVGPQRDVGEQVTIQPLIPFRLNTDWELIARPALVLTYAPGPGATFGLGDLQTSFFLTPARTGRWAWGVGPAFQLPTATSQALGAGKWDAGPTGALIYSEGPWFAGVLATQLWSFAGGNRPAVNVTSLEVNGSYNFKSGWYIQFDPTMTYDWAAAFHDARTIPLGLDVGKAAKLGALALSFQLGAYHFVVHPTDAAHWVVRAQITFLGLGRPN